eukprot:jgi/Psemu1/223052/e_gw1.1289.6.1
MSSYQDYYDLSSEDNDSDGQGSSSSSEEEYGDHGHNEGPTRRRESSSSAQNGNNVKDNALWERSILHIDVDCFYVQCEELDRGLRNDWQEQRHRQQQQQQQQQRPLAIGQKHIVVTCNYAARARGVTKLQSKTEAMRICPDLEIVDGSDLRRYRVHSRTVYRAFREVVRETIGPAVMEEKLPCQRNAMDEMVADLSAAVDRLSCGRSRPAAFRTYVFGDDAASSSARIVEDQSGASARVVFGAPRPSEQQQSRCRRKLELAVRLAHCVCEVIKARTQFDVSAGVSVSPMLAKLSVIQKPRTVNLLLPWRSPDLLYPMPLRKVPGVGSRTYRALAVGASAMVRSLLVLAQHGGTANANAGSAHRASAAAAASSSSSCEQHCDRILERCKGLDSTVVEDDGGGAPRTVSVENSFRRGTVTTPSAVVAELDELCDRLPPLVRDRADWSHLPSLAYPTTIRLTVRSVVKDNTNRPAARLRMQTQQSFRRHETRSKQATLGPQLGKVMLLLRDGNPSTSSSSSNATAILRSAVRPLLRDWMQTTTRCSVINVTRMNLAVTNFQDDDARPSLQSRPRPSLQSLWHCVVATATVAGTKTTRRGNYHCAPNVRSSSNGDGTQIGANANANANHRSHRYSMGQNGGSESNTTTTTTTPATMGIGGVSSFRTPSNQTKRATKTTADSPVAKRFKTNNTNTSRNFSRTTRIDQFFAKKP